MILGYATLEEKGLHYSRKHNRKNHNEVGTHIWHQNKDPSHSPVVVECTIPPFKWILGLHKQKGKKMKGISKAWKVERGLKVGIAKWRTWSLFFDLLLL